MVEDQDDEVDQADGGQGPGREAEVDGGVFVQEEERDEAEAEAEEEVDGGAEGVEDGPFLGAGGDEEEV